jgi:hypothetical protein
VRLVLNDGAAACSAVQAKPGIYFTAAHCLHTSSATLAGASVEVLVADDLSDLGVFRAPLKLPKILELGKAPKLLDAMNLIGYSHIPDAPFFFSGHVLATEIVPAEGVMPVLLVNQPVAPGMSGGPITDKVGKLISIISGGTDRVTGGVPYFHVAQAYRRYGQPAY